MNSITFNGQRREYLTTLRGKRRPTWAPLTRNLTDVESMPGAYLESTKVGVRILEVPVVIESQSLVELQKLKEDVADWLITDNPKELIFDDEPDRVYYAMVDGELDLDEIVSVGVGRIQFKCSDPYKYSTILESKTFVSNIGNVVNGGTVKTYPLFKAEVKESITHLDIISDKASSYMRAGKPYASNQEPFQPKTLILHDTMSTLVGWGAATAVDNGYVSGTMGTDGSGMIPLTWGSIIEPKSWQGPSRKKSLTESLKDFQMDVEIELLNDNVGTGMIEVYLLDSSNRVVGKVGFEDLYMSTKNAHGKAKAGDASTGKFFADEYATDNVRNWLNFKGIMRLQRVKNVWNAYFAVVDRNGKHINRRGDRGQLVLNDIQGLYGQNVTQVQVAFRIWAGTAKVPMRIDDIKIWRINEDVPEKIPYIAHAGDTIEFDHKTNDIRINGESRIDLKDFGSSYFPLLKGDNPIEFSPSESVDVTVDWRERFN